MITWKFVHVLWGLFWEIQHLKSELCLMTRFGTIAPLKEAKHNQTSRMYDCWKCIRASIQRCLINTSCLEACHYLAFSANINTALAMNWFSLRSLLFVTLPVLIRFQKVHFYPLWVYKARKVVKAADIMRSQFRVSQPAAEPPADILDLSVGRPPCTL